MPPAPTAPLGMLLFELNLADWGFILLANAIIFAILGKKLKADVEGWLDQLGWTRSGAPSTSPLGKLPQQGREADEE